MDKIYTKEKQPEMIKGYPIFEWIPVVSIIDQLYSEPKDEEKSFHSNEENDDIIEYEEGEGKTEE